MRPGTRQSIATALRRGLRKRCPHCGEGRLFPGGPTSTLFALRPRVRTQSGRYVGVHRHRRPAADCRDRRLDLLRRGSVASRAGPDDPRGVGGLLVWTAPNRWVVGIALHYLSRTSSPDPADPIPHRVRSILPSCCSVADLNDHIRLMDAALEEAGARARPARCRSARSSRSTARSSAADSISRSVRRSDGARRDRRDPRRGAARRATTG